MRAFLSRRDFLQTSGAALAAAAAAPWTRVAALADAPAKKARKLRKAIMYSTIGLKASVLEKFKAVKAAGFEGVEPIGNMNQDEVMKALEATGLEAASVCCNSHWNKPLSHPDPVVRQEGREGLLQALKDAKRYGATSVLLVPGVVNMDATYDECFKRSVIEIRKTLPLAEELGVKIAVENVWNNFITKPEQAVEFLDAIKSPLVGWHFDIGNAIRYSPPQTWIPVLGKRILKLHFKEYGQLKGFNVRFFEGDNDWPRIMKALDDIGYEGWGISEQPKDQSKDAESMKDLSDRLGRVFAT